MARARCSAGRHPVADRSVADRVLAPGRAAAAVAGRADRPPPWAERIGVDGSPRGVAVAGFP